MGGKYLEELLILHGRSLFQKELLINGLTWKEVVIIFKKLLK
jgi:hypothetical protein